MLDHGSLQPGDGDGAERHTGRLRFGYHDVVRVRGGQVRAIRTYMTGSVHRRRLWLLRRLMAERDSAAELRAYELRRFLLDQYGRVMAIAYSIVSAHNGTFNVVRGPAGGLLVTVRLPV